MLAVPVSFVSEHIETLEEIDVEYRWGWIGGWVPGLVKGRTAQFAGRRRLACGLVVAPDLWPCACRSRLLKSGKQQECSLRYNQLLAGEAYGLAPHMQSWAKLKMMVDGFLHTGS